jgi:hypothetical protein
MATSVIERVDDIEDALEACDEVHVVLARLKRLGLLSEREDREAEGYVQEIEGTLLRKLPGDNRIGR